MLEASNANVIMCNFFKVILKHIRKKNIDNISKSISENFSYEVHLKNDENIADLGNE